MTLQECGENKNLERFRVSVKNGNALRGAAIFYRKTAAHLARHASADNSFGFDLDLVVADEITGGDHGVGWFDLAEEPAMRP